MGAWWRRRSAQARWWYVPCEGKLPSSFLSMHTEQAAAMLGLDDMAVGVEPPVHDHDVRTYACMHVRACVCACLAYVHAACACTQHARAHVGVSVCACLAYMQHARARVGVSRARRLCRVSAGYSELTECSSGMSDSRRGDLVSTRRLHTRAHIRPDIHPISVRNLRGRVGRLAFQDGQPAQTGAVGNIMPAKEDDSRMPPPPQDARSGADRPEWELLCERLPSHRALAGLVL